MAYPLKFLDLTFAALFTAVVFLQWSFVMRDNERLFRSLHAYETGDMGTHSPPSSYFSIDWIVHPKHGHDTSRSFNMPISDLAHNGSCYSTGMSWNDADCGPEYWQTSDFCPPKTRTGRTITDFNRMLGAVTGSNTSAVFKDVLSQVYDKEKDSNKLVKLRLSINSNSPTDHYRWRNPNMGDVCRMERIGDMAVVMNDDTTYGLASAQSVSVLLLGAALVMWLANITDVIYNPKFMKNDLSVFVKNSKWILVGFAVGVIAVARIFSNTEITIGGNIMTRVLPNGSYYYVLLSVLSCGYILVNKTKKEHHYVAEDSEKDPLITDPHPGPNTIPMPNVIQVQPPKMGLDVSGFQHNKVQLNAYLPRSAPGVSTNATVIVEDKYNPAAVLGYSDFKNQTFDLQSSHFCVAQLFVLPLLTAAVYMVPTNYDTDSNFQVLFWAIATYGLIDVIVYRLSSILRIYGTLMNKDGKIAMDFDTVEVVNLGKVIDILALVLQTFIAIIVFSCMRWHLSIGTRQLVPVVGHDSMTERFLDYTPLIYIVYFAITNLTKTCALLSLMKRGNTSNPSRISGYYVSVVKKVGSQAENVLFLALNVFVAVLLIMLCYEMRRTEYSSPFPSITNALVKIDIDEMIHYYRGGWEPLNIQA